MKVRQGFVSNSSSASFIIRFKTIKPRQEVEQDLKNASEDIAETWEPKGVFLFEGQDGYKFQIEEEDGEFILEEHTTMFNDWYDIPSYNFLRMLTEINPKDTGYVLVGIEQTDGDDQFHEEAKFNPLCWEIQNFDTKSKGEAIARQMEIDNNYLEYLHKMRIKLTPQQVAQLAHHLLK